MHLAQLLAPRTHLWDPLWAVFYFAIGTIGIDNTLACFSHTASGRCNISTAFVAAGR